MVLQNLIFPSPDTCTEEEMYFRRNGEVDYTWAEKRIRVRPDGAIYFDTYFNSFSIGKWGKYTKLNHVYLTLKFKGKIRITLVRKERNGNEIINHYINEAVVSSSGEGISLKFSDADLAGIYSFDILAIRESVILGGYYWTDIEDEEIDDVKLALDICTFKRERFVKKNMELIQSRLFEQEEYREFREKIEVYLIDNAGTLKGREVEKKYIHLIKNKNVGGAGGFTRGLMEIKRRQAENGYSHALLMDDDVVLEPESLFRTWSLLRIIKEEFKGAFIGGAMLRLDRPYIQVESGAYWNQGSLISRKGGLDFRGVEPCLYNEIEEKVDYCAWWYCTIPLEVVKEDNLPLPIFIRGDDVEYGLRNAEKVILMNGICVWHEAFENKYSSTMFYYILRNRLIDNAIHNCPLGKKEFVRIMKKQAIEELYLYRYKNVRLLLQGVKDFYKGIDWFKEQDGQALHKKVMDGGYKMQFVEDVDAVFDYGAYEQSFSQPEDFSFTHRLIRKITMNGTLLKSKKENAVIPVLGGRQICVFRVNRIMNYDKANQKGFATMRDAKEAIECMRLLKETIRETDKRYDEINREYYVRGKELMSWEFWENYLR